MNERIRTWVTAILANDEASSNDELVDLFMHVGQLTEEEARAWIARRDGYLRGDDIPAPVPGSGADTRDRARLLIAEYLRIEAEIAANPPRKPRRYDTTWLYRRGVQQGLVIALALLTA